MEIVEAVRRPFLRADGTVLRVTGGGLSVPASLESYDYGASQRGGAGLLERDAAGITADGRSPRGTASWQGDPHWFRGDEVLVLYVGTDAAVLRILDEALGRQFAGA